ncbi:MAG: IS21 family transposase, partial [Patescibacteria group bacterium]
MNAELWATIRRLFEVDKLSKSAISKRLGVHRRTVRRAIGSRDGPPLDLPRQSDGSAKLEAYKGHLKSRIEAFPELSGIKLLREIKKQGYGGGITILKDYLQTIRPKKTREVFLRIETSPGDFAQVDWFNTGSVIIGNTRRRLSCFVMVLGYSRMLYLEFTLSQSLEAFIGCHVNAFNFFGGLTRKCLYDNLKSVCLYRNGTLIQFNERFMGFAGAYGFEPVLCNVARGNEKGKVENGGKYVKGNFLAGRPFILWPDIEEEAEGWRDEVANQRIHATTREQPMARFAHEQTCLLLVPEKGFDASIVRSVKATSQALIHFDGNRYSVPHPQAYKVLTVKASKGEVKIWEGSKLLTVHARSYERGVVVENPKHYEGILALKKQALVARNKNAF